MSGAAQDFSARLTCAQANQDLKTLIEFLEATHPDPYINMGGKIAFKRKVQEVAGAIPLEGLTVRELRDRLVPFLAGLQDGHTNLFSMDTWRDPEPCLPVWFGVASDGVFVASSGLEGLKSVKGWRVVGVNGIPLDAIIAKRALDYAQENVYAGYRGCATSLRCLKPMNRVAGPTDAGGSIAYDLESPDGRRETILVPWSARSRPQPKDLIAPPVRWPALKRSGDMFWYQIFNRPRAAYFRVSAIMGREAYEFDYRFNPENARRMVASYYQRQKRESPADFKEALQGIPSFFDITQELLERMKASHVPSLLIDLRGNSGGWTPTVFPILHAMYGDAFYAKPLPGEWVYVESRLALAKNGQTPEGRRKADPGFELGQYVFPKGQQPASAAARRKERVDEYLRAGYSFSAKLAALGGEPVYTPARVVVLCDAGTFSAAFHFMVYLRAMGARVVGVPSGQSPNAFMQQTPFTLPHSRLRGSISSSAQIFLPEDPRARVLGVDFPVTIDVFRRYGLDEETTLRYALDLIDLGKL